MPSAYVAGLPSVADIAVRARIRGTIHSLCTSLAERGGDSPLSVPRTWGLDLAGQVGQAGVRAELTRQRPDGTAAYTRMLVGADYAFGNTLTFTAELYFNGAGARDPSAYDFRALMSGETQALARRYVGLHAGYEITPLLKWDNDLVVNLADRSRYLAASLTWSLRTNLDLRLGVQRFCGAAGTEYARVPDTAFARLQRFF